MKPLHLHELRGCAPAPLAHYLKALGILRLVASQADPDARGFWRDEVFCLLTGLTREELLAFFLEDYRPTPLVAPWNGGSGFYPKDNRAAADAIAAGAAPRFASYRLVLSRAAASVAGLKERPADEEKEKLVSSLRGSLDEAALEWLRASVVVGLEKLEYPALLGTGGNDGRLDFTNNQMQWLVKLFDPGTGAPSAEARGLIASALFGEAVHHLPRNGAIGQFLPGGAGGPNSTAGLEGPSLFNPWDYLLTFEGAVVLEVAAVRRLDGVRLAQASAPFAIRGAAEGYSSAAPEDEEGRGEQWMPLWPGAATLGEVRALFAEGRLQVGRRRAQNAISAARAIKGMGTARGITEFVRYGYIERNGLSNLAVPLGRWTVNSEPDVKLLDEVEPWIDRLRSAAGSKGAPAAAERAVRRIGVALFETLALPSVPSNWQRLLKACGEAEHLLVTRSKWTREKNLAPMPGLSSGWVRLLDDASAEFRLAAAIASQSALRRFVIPLDTTGYRFRTGGDALLVGPEIAWNGRGLIDDLADVVERAVMEARRSANGSGHTISRNGFPLRGRVPARLDDVGRFLGGETDDAKVATLVRGMLSIRWDASSSLSVGMASASAARIDPRFAMLRWTYRTPRTEDDRVPLDPEPLRLLSAGRIGDALQRSASRLASSGYRPKFDTAWGTRDQGRRLLASLAIPISRGAYEKLARVAFAGPQADDA